ncbi:MAG TPA: hypothetical protein VFN09_09500 [Rhodanobacteraceae bacterium]|nr:hypothetical protein [Rhodanobacteraceae bacterium]
MKLANLAALILPFALLLVLIAVVVITPRIHSQHRHPPVQVTELPATIVTPDNADSRPRHAATRSIADVHASHGGASALRMPYFSFASDADHLPGR